MSIKTYDISTDEIHISAGMIAKLIGADPHQIPEPYDAIIQSELSEIHGYRDIRGGFNIVEDIHLNAAETMVQAGGMTFRVGDQVFGHIKEAESLAFFICTAGETVSSKAKQLMDEGLMLEGYIVDVIGSTIVEEAMDILHQRLSQQMNDNGLLTTNRYSPGYCEWDVQDQHSLFQLFPENFCGVQLTENALMRPVKSVSGIVGIGKEVTFDKYVCHACTSVNCIYRNIRHAV
jgi:hypothetical protein